MKPTSSRHDSDRSFELEELTVGELQEAMTSGRHTSRSITDLYLDRIAALDKGGPKTASIIELNPDALEIAERLDRERRARGPRGPLHGIPVLIKDNIDTSDQMSTTAGSLALVGSHPRDDAHLVSLLRHAGAVILGKTNLSEWANIRSPQSTSGWSALGGLTRNPYALDRNTSGSSAGSAAAVSANFCAVAVGTETDGSIVSPSSCCGIVGIKPTVGLVSRSGVVPISRTQDTPGPMARTVSDAAALLEVMAGSDPRDPASAEASGRSSGGYRRYLDARGLAGTRIGVVRSYFGYHPTVDAIVASALDLLEREGATIIDGIELTSLEALEGAELTLFEYELKADLDAYLGGLDPEVAVHSLEDVVEFNEQHARSEMPYFGQEIFLAAVNRGGLDEREYLEALETCRRQSRDRGIDAVMEKQNLDALVAPTGSPAWVTDFVNGDHYLGGSAQAAAVAGYPSITVPAGFAFGLPVGISFFGRQWSEPVLIRIAFAYEQASRVRRPPRFRPTAIEGSM